MPLPTHRSSWHRIGHPSAATDARTPPRLEVVEEADEGQAPRLTDAATASRIGVFVACCDGGS
jgi:hypothetical protein